MMFSWLLTFLHVQLTFSSIQNFNNLSKHHFARFQGKFDVQEKSEAEFYSTHPQFSFLLLYSTTKQALETHKLISTTIALNNT